MKRVLFVLFLTFLAYFTYGFVNKVEAWTEATCVAAGGNWCNGNCYGAGPNECNSPVSFAASTGKGLECSNPYWKKQVTGALTGESYACNVALNTIPSEWQTTAFDLSGIASSPYREAVAGLLKGYNLWGGQGDYVMTLEDHRASDGYLIGKYQTTLPDPGTGIYYPAASRFLIVGYVPCEIISNGNYYIKFNVVRGGVQIYSNQINFTVSGVASPFSAENFSLKVKPNQVNPGEQIGVEITACGNNSGNPTITTGQNVGILQLNYARQGAWKDYCVCGGATKPCNNYKITFCSHTWPISEANPGTYSYLGGLYDKNLTWHWTVPQTVSVTVSSPDTTSPSGTLSVSPNITKPDIPITVAVSANDEGGLIRIGAYFTGSWKLCRCDNYQPDPDCSFKSSDRIASKSCSNTWTTSESVEGNYLYVVDLMDAADNASLWVCNGDARPACGSDCLALGYQGGTNYSEATFCGTNKCHCYKGGPPLPVKVVIDNTPPVSNITNPPAGSSQAANFSVSATDADTGGSGLATCYYHIYDSVANWTKSWAARTCNSSFTVTVGPTADCRTQGANTCTVYAFAKDGAGNTGSSSIGSFSIDWTASLVTINQASGQADPTNASPINFTAVFSETVSGFTNSDVTIGGTAGGTKIITVTGSGATYNVAVAGMTNGTVTATIAANGAIDAAGNGNTASTSTDNTVTYDATVPPKPTCSPAGETFQNIANNVTCSDTESGVTIRYTLDGTSPTVTSTLYSGPFDIVSSATLKVAAWDGAGNRSDSPDNSYSFTIIFNQPPSIPNPASSLATQVLASAYCTANPSQKFNWVFSDLEDGSVQTAYWLQIGNNSNFLSPEFDSGKVISASQERYVPVRQIPGSNELSYNTSYYWRIQVYDSQDSSSGWVVYQDNTEPPESFRTPLHSYPSPNFTWLPSKPAINETVNFQDQTILYNGAICGAATCSWLWTMPGAFLYQGGTNQNSQNPKVKFSDFGDKKVTIEATDLELKNDPNSGSGSCSAVKTLTPGLPLPKWKEIIPWF